MKRDAGVQTRPHIVLRGESLWSIAENERGNGRRYVEIAALIADLLQGKGDGFLRPGWVLQLPVSEPGSAEGEASSQAAGTAYTVVQGDTLSGIARTHLGDETAFPKIVQASRAMTQRGGRHLTNPDVIDVGWTLNAPQQHGGQGHCNDARRPGL